MGQRGQSLISVLVAVAISGIVMVAIMTMNNSMNKMMMRLQINSDVENMNQYLKIALSQPGVCNKAFRDEGNPGPRVKWDLPSQSEVDIHHILLTNSNGNTTTALTKGQVLNPALSVSRIYLRKPNPDAGEGSPFGTTITENGNTYRMVASRLAIAYDIPKDTPGGALKERTIAMMTVVDQSNDRVEFCNIMPDSPIANFRCNESTLTNPTQKCDSDPSCTRLFYISGFNATGDPICKCKSLCGVPNVPAEDAQPCPPGTMGVSEPYCFPEGGGSGAGGGGGPSGSGGGGSSGSGGGGP